MNAFLVMETLLLFLGVVTFINCPHCGFWGGFFVGFCFCVFFKS